MNEWWKFNFEWINEWMMKVWLLMKGFYESGNKRKRTIGDKGGDYKIFAYAKIRRLYSELQKT